MQMSCSMKTCKCCVCSVGHIQQSVNATFAALNDGFKSPSVSKVEIVTYTSGVPETRLGGAKKGWGGGGEALSWSCFPDSPSYV